MLEKFSHLSIGEIKQLKDAIAQITVLISGADGEIDRTEKEWAEKVASIRGYKMHKDLIEFYQNVGTTFHDDLESLIDSLPTDVAHRQGKLVGVLGELNSILAKLDPQTGTRLYKSYLSFAKHVAKASGGVLGFFSINNAERQLIDLPMLNPILAKTEEEE
jgi:hypothetical protein